MNDYGRLISLFFLLAAWAVLTAMGDGPRQPQVCNPTPQYDTGPFYQPGAPVRDQIGEGYKLIGKVLSAEDCEPIADAKIELWTTGPDGRYEDRWRATTFSDADGDYQFETHFPGRYGTRPPHIHIVVTAPGFTRLVTQQFPTPGEKKESFDLVLLPSDLPSNP